MKKKSRFSPGYILVICGISLTTLIAVVSLFLFLRSVTSEELKNSIRYARDGHLEDPPGGDGETGESGESSDTETETGDTSTDETAVSEAAVSSEAETSAPATEASAAEGSADSPHSLDFTDELGVSSDLEMQDAPEDIYFVMLDTAMGPMMYYNQGDRRWADYLYGGEDPLEGYGCGPTAVAMLISSFSLEGGGMTPVDLADWASENGYYALHSGSYHSLIPESLTAFGFTVESVTDRSREHVSQLLEDGHVLAALMGKGTLTNNGHFILITKLLDDGNVRIADPNSYENSRKEWELDLLLSELKKGAASGGPLWAVRMEQAE